MFRNTKGRCYLWKAGALLGSWSSIGCFKASQVGLEGLVDASRTAGLMVSTIGSWSHSACNERKEKEVLKDICAKEEAGFLERTGAKAS